MAKLSDIEDLAPPGLIEPGSRKVLKFALQRCRKWDAARGSPDIDRAWFSEWRHYLVTTGLSRRSCNAYMAVIRSLLNHAYDLGLIELDVLIAAGRVRHLPVPGARRGQWLTKGEADRLLEVPDTTHLRGVRDRALMALMLGAGLRLGDVAALDVSHLSQIEGRVVVRNLEGKHGRTRSVPVADWAARMVHDWLEAADIGHGPVFRPMPSPHWAHDDRLSKNAINMTVKRHGRAIGLEISPHDLRRTFAKLAYAGGAPLDQISLSLGHGSLETTQTYLGIEQDLQQAPADYFELRVDP